MQFCLCGNVGSDPELNPYRVCAPPPCQEILRLINASPLDAQSLAARTGIPEVEVRRHLRALERAGLVRPLGEAFRPGFAIFTERDLERLGPWVATAAGALAGVVQDRMAWVARAHEECRFPERGYTLADTGYILVGAYIFDFGGLALEGTGYLVAAQEMPGGRYVFTGLDGEASLGRRWMWGHSATFGPFTFFGHGELPAAGARRAFPDRAWFWARKGRPQEEIDRTMTELGGILVALSGGPRPEGELAEGCGIEASLLTKRLGLLAELGYVVSEGRRWRSLCPVVDEPAREAIGNLVDRVWACLLRQGVEPQWKELERLYSATAPARNGIPLPVAFNPLHHLVFDQALRQLMEEGTIACPPRREDGVRYALWVEWQGRYP